jgi:hypothetical protein
MRSRNALVSHSGYQRGVYRVICAPRATVCDGRSPVVLRGVATAQEGGRCPRRQRRLLADPRLYKTLEMAGESQVNHRLFLIAASSVTAPENSESAT